MKTTVILSLAEKRGTFRSCYIQREYENISLVEIRNNRHALNKLSARLKDENVIIRCGEENSRIYNGRVQPYTKVSVETILPVLEKICFQTIQKFNLEYPLEEICIIAGPSDACKIVSTVNFMSRIFTVVSETENDARMYDEVYFKYGAPIRHMSDFKNDLPENSLIINCMKKNIPLYLKRPVINMSESNYCSSLCVNAFKIHIEDSSILTIEKYWGGVSSAFVYSLTEEKPSENAIVDINKKADEIFLLDTI